MENFIKSSVQLANLSELYIFHVPKSGARYSTEEKAKPMATLARLTSQTVKFVYHQDQEFAPHKEHVYPMSLQQAINVHKNTLEVCILT